MGHTDFASMACPIARSMAVLGERWTILLMREAYYGSTRFDDFQRNLGIAPNILSARLKTLVEHGVFEKVAEEGARHIYRLTERGRDFFPAFVALKAWADRWMTDATGPLTVLRDAVTGDEIASPALTRADGSAITVDDLLVTPGPGAGERLRRRFGDGSAESARLDGADTTPAKETGHV
ncbi:helix-turn-helix domain-containing protein [Cupriavidus sp. AU9028]|uniref:winged helix-turn-helix transcriptional regulator n=1 Tax=Cupriavidus sp. AU9028 TaxID=2871157 RepID=UPI001C959814|nr:helix-turn-helix domain-containing protein [Cupriavidus sp. AU9028]MBY4898285.1 helix-turn-helix transcriptional regulator [Cupriavidus sp. AU9028]